MSFYLLPSDILLPDFSAVDGTAYATVACDQFTGAPEYWKELYDTVGEKPSTLQLILPEAFLAESESRIPAIHAKMEEYLRGVLQKHPNSMIYLERTLSTGEVRRGIIGMIDLENYDFQKGSESMIRPTEETVPSRIPPRLAVRRDALLESPHVMLLIDDYQKTVIEPLTLRKERMEPAYAFELVKGSGAVKAWFMDSVGIGRVETALEKLCSPERMTKRFGEGTAPLLFAVGDGNHSLAVAKASYEEIKKEKGEEALSHPARYALVEVVNLHDDSLHFEPIYRVMTGVNPNEVLEELEQFSLHQHGACAGQQVRFLSAARKGTMHFEHPSSPLTVATLQQFIDGFLKSHPTADVDYIHGSETVEKIAEKENAVGFLFEGMAKDELFLTVVKDGALPRKTFSMGHAEDKRFYIECRRIK